MEVQRLWSTENMKDMIVHMARVSNPANQNNMVGADKLIKYLIKHKHWSPFEMVSACFKITVTRDIARQILRHRSFSFQEFSQRYAEASEFTVSEVRTQDLKNRQSSHETSDDYLKNWWLSKQDELLTQTELVYKEALDKGIAKEVARKILPEGLTMSTMYMSGTLRSWIHYVQLRCGEGTQKEHRLVACEIRDQLLNLLPELEETLMEVQHG